MNSKIVWRMVGLTFLILGGCAGAGSKPGNVSKTEYEKAVAAAKAAQRMAASVGGEWRDVDKFLRDAAKAAKAADYAKAIRLATKARVQSELGYKQAQDEKPPPTPSCLQ
jgi:hypothetical protein